MNLVFINIESKIIIIIAQNHYLELQHRNFNLIINYLIKSYYELYYFLIGLCDGTHKLSLN